MNKTLLSLSFLGIAYFTNAQVGVGTSSPKATLDVTKSDINPTSTPDGIRYPNMTKADLASKGATIYGASQIGTIVYVTDFTGGTTGTSASQVVNINMSGYYFFDGTVWQKMSSTTGGDTTNDAWVNNPTATRVELGTSSNGTTARTVKNGVVITDTGRIGIGTKNVPDAGLHVVGDGDDYKDDIRLDSYGGDATIAPAANFRMYGARGTQDTPLAVLAGDTLGQFNFWYHTGSTFATGAKISSNYRSSAGSDLIFSTGGASNATMTMTEKGSIGIATLSPNATLDVRKSATNATSTADGVRPPNMTKTELANKAPSTYAANQIGTMVYVTDAAGGTTGTSVSQVIYINAPGFYTFDGNTWQSAAGSVPKIRGTMRAANTPIQILGGTTGGTTTNGTITLSTSVDKIHLGSYIDLPTGKWEVEANVLVYLGLPTNVLGLNYIFNKFTFTEETTPTVNNQSADLPPTSQSGWLIGGSSTIFGGSSGSGDAFYSVINGKVFITNNTSNVKRYYLVLWQGSRKYSNYSNGNGTQTASTSLSITGLGSSANGENYITAMKIQ